MKGQTESNTIITEDWNIRFASMTSSSRQSINMKKLALNGTVDQMDIIDYYRTFHPQTAKCTFFSSAQGTLSWIDHMLGHKTNLSNFKKIEIISSVFSNHNNMKLEINYKDTPKKHKHVESKQYASNNMNH